MTHSAICFSSHEENVRKTACAPARAGPRPDDDILRPELRIGNVAPPQGASTGGGTAPVADAAPDEAATGAGADEPGIAALDAPTGRCRPPKAAVIGADPARSREGRNRPSQRASRIAPVELVVHREDQRCHPHALASRTRTDLVERLRPRKDRTTDGVEGVALPPLPPPFPGRPKRPRGDPAPKAWPTTASRAISHRRRRHRPRLAPRSARKPGAARRPRPPTPHGTRAQRRKRRRRRAPRRPHGVPLGGEAFCGGALTRKTACATGRDAPSQPDGIGTPPWPDTNAAVRNAGGAFAGGIAPTPAQPPRPAQLPVPMAQANAVTQPTTARAAAGVGTGVTSATGTS